MTNEEQHEQDKLFLEAYKERCNFYEKFIEYLHDECVGLKDGIIEAVAENMRNEFIGYVDTEKEIDKNGDVIIKFKRIIISAYFQYTKQIAGSNLITYK